MLEKLARQLKNVENDLKDTKDRMGENGFEKAKKGRRKLRYMIFDEDSLRGYRVLESFKKRF